MKKTGGSGTATALAMAMCVLAAGVCRAGREAGDAVPSKPGDIRPLLIGDMVPDVKLATPEGQTVGLRSQVLQKPTVLIFYRGGWCPYCTAHLGQLQEAEADLLKLGFQIVAISPDQPAKLVEMLGKTKVSYSLLSDSKAEAARAFRIAFRVDQAMLEKLASYHIDIEAASGQKHHILPVPAVFVVGKDGAITFSYVNPDYKERLSPDVLIAAARAAVAE